METRFAARSEMRRKDRNEMRAGKRPAYASLVAKICEVEGFDVEFAKILDDEILFD